MKYVTATQENENDSNSIYRFTNVGTHPPKFCYFEKKGTAARRNSAERSVSFNQDVRVKRIGESLSHGRVYTYVRVIKVNWERRRLVLLNKSTYV
jgi:hypothetical protein